jgi:hypothetical protein
METQRTVHHPSSAFHYFMYEIFSNLESEVYQIIAGEELHCY